MNRTPVNPWPWSLEMGFNQAEVIEGHTRELVVSGQTAMSADGSPQHAGDMAAQISMSLDNLDAVLSAAGMDLGNVVRLNVYTTDVDGTVRALPCFGRTTRRRRHRAARHAAGC